MFFVSKGTLFAVCLTVHVNCLWGGNFQEIPNYVLGKSDKYQQSEFAESVLMVGKNILLICFEKWKLCHFFVVWSFLSSVQKSNMARSLGVNKNGCVFASPADPDSAIFLSVKMQNKKAKHRSSTKYMYFNKITGPTLFFSGEKIEK